MTFLPPTDCQVKPSLFLGNSNNQGSGSMALQKGISGLNAYNTTKSSAFTDCMYTFVRVYICACVCECVKATVCILEHMASVCVSKCQVPFR